MRVHARFPAVASALLLLGAAFSRPPIRIATTLTEAPDVWLHIPVPYLVAAPFCGVADTLSLLTLEQHLALFATLLVLLITWRVRADRRSSIVRTVAAEVGIFAAALVVVVAVYAVAVLVPRPMARLVAAGRDMVVVDFHTHTDASHDGRHGWTPERVRTWHRRSGYDAAYVTDHRYFTGAEVALATNPPRSGQGTSLFSGIEVISTGLHLNVLGASIDDSAYFRYRSLSPDSIMRFVPARGGVPVVLLTIPGPLSRVEPAMQIRAVEISDAAPKGLQATQREFGAIVHLADSLDWALVAGTDNHGWGNTAVGWSVMRVPGWRAMAPDSLDRAIRAEIARGGSASVLTVERSRIDPQRSALWLVGTVPEYAWLLMRTLSWPERLAWFAWIAAGWLLARASRSFRRPRRAPA